MLGLPTFPLREKCVERVGVDRLTIEAESVKVGHEHDVFASSRPSRAGKQATTFLPGVEGLLELEHAYGLVGRPGRVSSVSPAARSQKSNGRGASPRAAPSDPGVKPRAAAVSTDPRSSPRCQRSGLQVIEHRRPRRAEIAGQCTGRRRA